MARQERRLLLRGLKIDRRAELAIQYEARRSAFTKTILQSEEWPRKALLVVDIDFGDCWDPESISGDKERQRIERTIRETLVIARAKGTIVIFVVLDRGEQTQLKDGKSCIGCCYGAKTNKLAEFLGHRHGNCFEPVFVKEHADAFTNQELAQFLRSAGVEEVLLIGCNTFACVKKTAIGALKEGFNVTLLDGNVYPSFRDQKQKKYWIEIVRGKIPAESKLKVKIV